MKKLRMAKVRLRSKARRKDGGNPRKRETGKVGRKREGRRESEKEGRETEGRREGGRGEYGKYNRKEIH